MAKVFQKSTLEVFHMDEERGKAKRIKNLPNLIETADEATVKGAMQKIVNTHAFEKAGKKEFEGVVSAAYVDRTVTQVFKDEK